MTDSQEVLQKIKKAGHHADAWVITLTPELARILVAAMAHNRPVRQGRVDYYASLIESGEWTYTGEGIILSTEGKMINGQHRCLAVIQTGITIEILVVTEIQPENWLRMDQGSSRMGSDMIEVPLRSTVAAALSLIHREQRGWRYVNKATTGRPLTPPETPAMLKAFPEVVDTAMWAHDHTGVGMIRMPEGLLAYCLFRARMHDRGKAEAFVGRLSDGLELTADSPAYQLRERLMANAASKSKLPKKEILALWIKAWIAFDAGRSLRKLGWSGKKGHKVAEKFPTWPGPALPGTVAPSLTDDDAEESQEPTYVPSTSHEPIAATG